VVLATFSKFDDHLSPSILVLNEGGRKGQIVIAYSFHSSPLFFSYSTTPENINSFVPPVEILSRPTTYPNLIESGQNLSIYFRGHPVDVPSSRGVLQRINTVDLMQWSEVFDVIKFNQGEYIYHKINTKEGRILLGWSVFSKKSRKFSNAYFSYSDDNGVTWNYFDTKAGVWGVTHLLTDEIPVLLNGEQIRVYDLAVFSNRFYISATKYHREYTCCGDLVESIILKLSDGVEMSSFNSNTEYYASGAIFDSETEGVVYSVLNIDNKNSIIFRYLDQELKTLVKGPIYSTDKMFGRLLGVKNKKYLGEIGFIEIEKYRSYLDFESKLMILK